MPRLIVVAVALCAIGLSAALLADTPVTVTAQAQTFRPRFQAYGQVVPIQVLTVQAGIAGLIEDLDVVPGQQLKPGDIIARIGGTEQASAIDKARAVQTAAEQAFQAALDAEKAAVKVYPKFSDRAHLDAAKAQLAEARAKLSNAKTEVARLLSLSTVTSPVSGRIVSLKSANGDRVSAGSPVLVMQPQNDLWVEAVFYDISPSVLASGQSAVFKPAGSGAALNVRLAQVAPTLRADGGQTVYFDSAPETRHSPQWRDGQRGDVTIEGEAQQVVAVPTEALVLDNGRWWVLRQTSEGFTRTQVEPGPSQGDNTILLQGVQPGAQVVVRDAYLLFHREFGQHYMPPD